MMLEIYAVCRCVTRYRVCCALLLATEDWERELAKTLLQYSGCVDANVLQYTWPVNFDKYRILLVSSWCQGSLFVCIPQTQRLCLLACAKHMLDMSADLSVAVYLLQVSGPADDPLLTCFVPANRNRAVEDLYEIIIRNDRGKVECTHTLVDNNGLISAFCADHYTLLRPMENLNSRIKVRVFTLRLLRRAATQ
jgi:hypothetical protein